MTKWIETTGKNEEEAIAAALRQLGMDRDDVSVEIIDRAKSGFLGIGSVPAKVRVSYEAPDEPEVKEEPQEAPAAKVQEAPAVSAEKAPAEEPKEAAEPAEAKVPEGDETAEKIAAFLTGLLEHMNVSAAPSISVGSDGSYQVVLVGENLGALIGRRGETLDAIQQLTS